MNDGVIIHLIRDGQQSVTHSTSANNVGALADELGVSSYTAAVNGGSADASTSFERGDTVAMITKNKTGGN